MAKRITFVLVAVLVIYLAFAFNRGLDLFKAGGWQLIILGTCVMALPILGAWLVIREVRFGYRTSELGKKIDANLLPLQTVRTRSEEATQYLAQAIERTKSDETDWRNWYCVGIGYDLVGQRKLARESLYYAVELAEKRD
ncbi:MAG: hypothetical protein KGQ38_05385 [Actinomycetales bacterium]|nr:hypothetical protein [Actinomycetales bacterium]